MPMTSFQRALLRHSRKAHGPMTREQERMIKACFRLENAERGTDEWIKARLAYGRLVDQRKRAAAAG